MPDIYIAAIISNSLSLLIIGGMLLSRTPKDGRLLLAMLVLFMCPMNPLVFWLVRVPVDGLFETLLGNESDMYHIVRTLYAPLTEEPAKLWILLIPCFYQRIKSTPIHRTALAIGLGFGIGEAWTVAILLSKSPEITKYPWYMLRGYILERMMVCIMHAAFTAAALWFIIKKRRIAVGLLACIILHFLGNLPIFLAKYNCFYLGQNIWRIILQTWIVVYFLAMGCLLAYITYGKGWLSKLIRGKVRCPECKEIYKHPIFGFNLFTKRYERCPQCRHWHLVSSFDEEE
jgi:hypothetical protein